MNWLRNLFTPNNLTVAERQLAQARLDLMEAQSGKAFAEAMIAYNTDIINRHEALLQQHNSTSIFTGEQKNA